MKLGAPEQPVIAAPEDGRTPPTGSSAIIDTFLFADLFT
jgi:hypothetical protein